MPTPQAIEDILTLNESGVQTGLIATTLGISRQTIYKVLAGKAVITAFHKGQLLTKLKKAAIVKERKAGLSFARISVKLHVSKNAVMRCCKAAGLSPSKKEDWIVATSKGYEFCKECGTDVLKPCLKCKLQARSLEHPLFCDCEACGEHPASCVCVNCES